jgi:hypothetical protein
VDAEIDAEDMQKLKDKFLLQLRQNHDQIKNIEESTRTQRDSSAWYEQRSVRLTASNFGRVCNMRASTNRSNFVKELLVPNFSGNKFTKYGIDNEINAFRAIKQVLTSTIGNVPTSIIFLYKHIFTDINSDQIKDCGLFISEQHPFLAASPDGMIGDFGLIEIKCPYTARELTPEEAIISKKIKFAKLENGSLKLKRTHAYYFQVQGQLLITNRSLCYFVIWTPKGMIFEKIEADADFFAQTMLPKLKCVYFEHLLPALIQRGDLS